MLTFLSPLFLIGLASAAIPLIIHLTRSRRTKKMQFSTTRFFTDQFLRSYRMSQVKELLLLLVRMALCALFAVALAKPLLQPPGRSLLFGQSRSVVLVIDNSASMGYSEGGVTLLDRARNAARQVLDSLEQGHTASVVLAARRAGVPEVVFPELTPDLGDVRQAIDRLTATHLGTDLSGAVAVARRLLQPSKADSREIYVFSDLQATGWEFDQEKRAVKDNTLLFLVRTAPESVRNAGVTAVQYGTARPMLGVPFAVRAAVRNDGDEPRTVTARLFIDGDKDPVGERKVETAANRWQIVRFHHTFAKGGWHSGKVTIDADNLAADNERYFAFEVQDSIRVLAVNGAPSAVPRTDELFFFRTALTVGPEGESPVRVDVVNAANFESAKLNEYPLVVWANVESLPAGAVEKLEQYVDAGGNLLVFLGDHVNPEFYNRTLTGPTRLHGGLLPARLDVVVGQAASLPANPAGNPSIRPAHSVGQAGSSPHDVAFVAAVDYDHPALATFEDPKFGNLSNVSFRAFYRLEPTEGATVLMRSSAGGTSGGSPLLVEKRFGQGRTMLFASTVDRDWTNFPVRPSYLPWVYRLTSYLAQERLARLPFFLTGSRVPIPFSAGEGLPQVTVKKPDGTAGRAVLGNDPASPLEFADTTEPGVYVITEQGRESSPRLFVANLDGDESRFEPLLTSQAEAKDVFEDDSRVAFVADASRVAEASIAARRGFGLWDALLFAALTTALLEPWLANRISMRHYGPPGTVPTQAERRTGRIGRRPAGARAQPASGAASETSFS
ncbi:MAG: VWA domain-containing protein [Planctomycetes bacterium]|nr:VWA domain-containing protein [Planctomycetota bacterium]